ncbi:hypothetical protein BB560_001342 [Smittium megazygosporum]|uniref:Phosphoribulokinase/uridine kinase domain-containing protein n=1 Tax=Smittium megazygosporum TaxID=133381 RepID=A0A2T9ZHU5_9FUNG|nr:hypothetical protein BB560_001342 [Smittium megazygosporum]
MIPNLDSFILTFGISGPSCSGKTTLALMLNKYFRNSVILYKDNYYKTPSIKSISGTINDDKYIQIHHASGYKDYDSPNSFDSVKMEEDIKCIQKDWSKVSIFSDLSSTSSTWAIRDLSKIEEIVNNIKASDTGQYKKFSKNQKVLIVEGIFLFEDNTPHSFVSLFDIRVFLTLELQSSLNRRTSRIDIIDDLNNSLFWQDPPNYFNLVSWPNYIFYSKKILSSISKSNIVTDKAIDKNKNEFEKITASNQSSENCVEEIYNKENQNEFVFLGEKFLVFDSELLTSEEIFTKTLKSFFHLNKNKIQ